MEEKTTVQTPAAYKVSEIAELLQIGRVEAYRLVKEDRFRVVRIGRCIRIPKNSFDAWLNHEKE